MLELDDVKEVFGQAGEIVSCEAQDDEGICFQLTYKHLIHAIKAVIRFSGVYLKETKAFLQVKYVPTMTQQVPQMPFMPPVSAQPITPL